MELLIKTGIASNGLNGWTTSIVLYFVLQFITLQSVSYCIASYCVLYCLASSTSNCIALYFFASYRISLWWRRVKKPPWRNNSRSVWIWFCTPGGEMHRIIQRSRWYRVGWGWPHYHRLAEFYFVIGPPAAPTWFPIKFKHGSSSLILVLTISTGGSWCNCDCGRGCGIFPTQKVMLQGSYWNASKGVFLELSSKLVSVIPK